MKEESDTVKEAAWPRWREAFPCVLLSAAFIWHFTRKTLLLFQFYADAQGPRSLQSLIVWLLHRQFSLEYYFSS